MAACTKNKAEEAYPFFCCLLQLSKGSPSSDRRSPIPYQHSKQDEKETLAYQKENNTKQATDH